MQKIMFNDKYGLTAAVLEGRKTMTRRLFKMTLHTMTEDDELKKIDPDDVFVNEAGVAYFVFNGCGTKVPKENQPAYKIGEVVAVAQSYQAIEKEIRSLGLPLDLKENIAKHKGYTNKMFVNASDMPHQIRITDVRVERLQDISDEGCLKEGIVVDAHRQVVSDDIYMFEVNGKHYNQWHFYNPREAFAALIDKVGKKGTWESNPWVYVYSFELVK